MPESFFITLDLSDVRIELFREEFLDLVRKLKSDALRLIFEDRKTQLVIRERYVRENSALEAAPYSVLKSGEILRRTVGGEYDLLMLLVEGIERVEKLLLRRILARDELNVVDQQRIHLCGICF